MPIIKISDIARNANVSPSTVERVIHNNGKVSKEKREIVENVINQLEYVPNGLAQGLKNKRTNIIGHILPLSYKNSFFSKIGEAIDKVAEAFGYHVLTVVVSQRDAKKEQILIKDLVRHRVDAIIFTAEIASQTSIIEWLINTDIPVIMIERPRDVIGIDKILMNNREGSIIATSHIISNGHKKIGFIGKYLTHMVEKERFEGYRDTLLKSDIKIQEEYVKLMPEYSMEYGYEAMKEILDVKNLPSAVFVASDIFICGAMQYIYEKRLRIPDDISLVGFDDTISGFLPPAISSVAFPMEEVGKVAIEMIIERRMENRKVGKVFILSPIFIDRNSVRKIERDQNCSGKMEII